MMQNVKTVFLDIDDTLWWFTENSKEAFAHVYNQHGLTPRRLLPTSTTSTGLIACAAMSASTRCISRKTVSCGRPITTARSTRPT